MTSITQNGFATGQLSTVSIDATGIVSAVYTNGRSTQLGQVAMANFPNPRGLKQLGDTNWAADFHLGHGRSGTAGSAGFGTIQSGALESFERRSDHGAGEHDHRAARLPGERAGHHHGESELRKPSSTSTTRTRQKLDHGQRTLRGDDRREANHASAGREQSQHRQHQHHRLSGGRGGLRQPADLRPGLCHARQCRGRRCRHRFFQPASWRAPGAISISP